MCGRRCFSNSFMYLSVLKRAEDCSFVQPSLVAGPLTAKVRERA